MNPSQQNAPRVKIVQRPDYRDEYANSVQIVPSTWDFFIQFGRLVPRSPEEVELHMFQGVYLSPQQAKAMIHLLNSHLESYEKAFGEIQLSPLQSGGPLQ